jgi:hypothetical protein
VCLWHIISSHCIDDKRFNKCNLTIYLGEKICKVMFLKRWQRMHLRNVLKYKKYYKSRRIEMGYSKDKFKKDMFTAVNESYDTVCFEYLKNDFVVPHLLPYFVGDKLLKRELQVSLDKFSALSDAEMYTKETDCDAPEGELCMYGKKAKILLGMMDNKIKRIIDNPSKFGLCAFTVGRSKMATIEFIKKVQLLIDLM